VRLLDRIPVPTFEEVTGIYGEPREGHTHAGVDFKAPEGTPVRTVMGGTVTRINWNTAYNGYCVEIDMGNYSEIFLHLQLVSPGVVPGITVGPGDRIGAVGNTGRSYSPHLHYQINDSDGNAIDPYLYYGSHNRWLGGTDQEEYRLFRERCDALLDRGDRT
jgi:murein DD-endopeptidase MepM/ murein hydrolase activator NlpD